MHSVSSRIIRNCLVAPVSAHPTSRMNEIRPVAVPRLRLPQKVPPLTHYGQSFDVGSGSSPYTPKVGSPTFDPSMFFPQKAVGKIPGYSGHLPLVSPGYVMGKGFGVLSRLDGAAQDPFRSMGSPTEWPGEISRFGRPSVPQSARDSQLTIAETRALTAKFRHRYLGGEDQLKALRLKATSPRAHTARSERTTFSFQEEESGSQRTRRTDNRQQPADAAIASTEARLRPISGGGRVPLRENLDWRVCASLLRSFGLSSNVFDAGLDSIFPSYGPETGWSCGELYEIPKGWLGFGLTIPAWAERRDIFDKWTTSFYPCPPEYLETILRTGSLVVPGDTLLDGSKSKTVFLAQKFGVEKSDPNTPRKDRCTTRVYTTPSIRYAMLKLGSLTRNAGYIPFQGKRLSIVLQCKQMGGGVIAGGFQKCGDTIGWEHTEAYRGDRISPVVHNHEIEYYTLRRSSVVPYRVLFKVDDLEIRSVTIPNSGGTVVTGPATQYKDIKWLRVDQPPYGAMSAPGLTLPYTDFLDPGILKDVRSGGVECPKPRGPYVAYPEQAPVRSKRHDPMLRASTQPTEPEALIFPSKGWVEGTLPDSLKGLDARRTRTVTGVLAEMKEKFSVSAGSLKDVFDRLAAHNDGQLLPSDLSQILLRLNIVRRLDDPILEELWELLDEDGGGSVSIAEFAQRFGLVGKSDSLLENFRSKMGGRFKLLRAAFRDVDADHSGTVDKEELRTILLRFNLLAGVDPQTYDELWGALDRDGSGSINYVEFAEKFAGQAGNIVTAVGNDGGTKVQARKTHTAAGSRAHTVAALCDEGTACYAQMDYDTAEQRYRAAIKLDPSHVVSLCSLAWLLRNTKNDVLGARGLLMRAAEIDPQHPYLVMQRSVY